MNPIDKKRYKEVFNVNETSVKKIKFNDPGSYGVFLDNYSGDLELIIEVKGVNLEVWGRYVGKNDDNLKLNLNIVHGAGGSSSKTLIRGVAFDKSAIDVTGMIVVERDCNGTEAVMNVDGMLVGSGQIEFLPELKIASNDVVCRHGSTVGQISQEQLDYLRSRGINEKSAKDLLIDGFIAEAWPGT